MARQGVLVDRSTLASWMGYAAAELSPVVGRLREMVLASGRMFADETTVPVLDLSTGIQKGPLIGAQKGPRSRRLGNEIVASGSFGVSLGRSLVAG
jgi:hypothetical protein